MIDTHTHIYTEDFRDDEAEVIERARLCGIEAILLPNTDVASLPDVLRMCGNYPDICHPMIGLHPTEMPESGVGEALDQLEAQLFAASGQLPPNSPYVAVGEIGMDLYWDTSREEEQRAAFVRQLEWAVRAQLPVSIHARSAHRQTIEALRPFVSELPGGVFHCFGGTADEARELLETFPRFALGIGGVLTFKKSPLPTALRLAVPLNRRVLETDAPYLAPTPYRGKRNEPSYLLQVVEHLARLYEVTPEEVRRVTTATARAIFRLPASPAEA